MTLWLRSIFSDLVHVLGLKKASKKAFLWQEILGTGFHGASLRSLVQVKLQLLQTLSMLVQNIRRQTLAPTVAQIEELWGMSGSEWPKVCLLHPQQ